MVDTLTVDGGSSLGSPTMTLRWQYSNHLGTASLEVDEAAALISYEEYHPFGTSAYRSGRSAAETSLKRYRYVGKERDDESGLYYYGARYYAAWLCRFVSVDPLKDTFPQLNPYNYAGNKPVSGLDLDGLQGTEDEEKSEEFKSGNEEFDKVANKALEDYADSNVVIETQTIDGQFQGRITITSLEDASDSATTLFDPERGWFGVDGDELIPLQSNDAGQLSPSGSPNIPNASGGAGAVTLYDSEMRRGYIENVERTGQKNLNRFDEASTPEAKEKVMNEAVDERNQLKKETRKKQSPGGRAVQKALEQDDKYTPEKLKEAYGKGGEKGTNLEGEELNRKITEKSGSSNKTLGKVSKWGKRLGWIGVIIGAVVSTKNIIEDPTPETIGEEAGSWIGGAIGSTLGTAGAIALVGLLGIALGPVGIIAVAFVGGAIGGYIGGELGGKGGKWLGGKVGKVMDERKKKKSQGTQRMGNGRTPTFQF